MKKRIWGIFLGILCTAALTGCGGPQEEGTEDKKEKVELTVWGAEEDTELMNIFRLPLRCRVNHPARML